MREDGTKGLSFQTYTKLYEEFDAEILKKMAELNPKEFREALSSAGNMHNPKIVPLRKVFQEALLKIPSVTRLNHEIETKGYEIVEAGSEKLSIDHSMPDLRVKVSAWLICQPKNAEQGGAPNR